MEKLPITVVVPIRNEERNLPACLARLGAFAEVWVVDSNSSDRSREIVAEHGFRLLDFDWPGGFPKKRNWVLLNERFATPWVLFLDADEQVTEAFVAEAREAVRDTGKAGFWLNYTTHFMGGILHHGVAQRKLALIRVGAGMYERIDDARWSHLDMEIHEHPVLDGPVGEIAARIDHLDFRGIEHFVARHNGYSSWEASRWEALGPPGSPGWATLTERQRVKYRNIAKWWFAPFYFLLTYVAKRGFLDGRRGLDYALLKAHYFHSVRLKILEKRAQ